MMSDEDELLRCVSCGSDEEVSIEAVPDGSIRPLCVSCARAVQSSKDMMERGLQLKVSLHQQLAAQTIILVCVGALLAGLGAAVVYGLGFGLMSIGGGLALAGLLWRICE